MSIIFNKKEKIFNLKTNNTLYQMMIAKSNVLMHTYYGEAFNEGNAGRIWRSHDHGFSGNIYETESDRTFSLDTLPQEFTSYGVGDFRVSSVNIENGDGTHLVDWRYVEHKIYKGKYGIEGMPALYGLENDAETLEITLKDVSGFSELTLYYSVFEEFDIITRCAKVKNLSDTDINLCKLSSLCLDLPCGKWKQKHFYGRHTMERIEESIDLPHGITAIGSRRGTSSHQHNPFIILHEDNTTEDYGECYGMALLYSGGFLIETEVDQIDQTRVVMGIQPEGFKWRLSKEESFITPEVVITYSNNGFTKLSHNYHDVYRSHLIRGKYKDGKRPVLINNWEATYFDFNANKLVDIAKSASKLGVDLLVMDDGWFTNRNDDKSGLGDWIVDDEKLNGTLENLVKRVNDEGMEFGIWFEPEMISEISTLYTVHPEWVLKAPNRKPNKSRSQLVLDLSREDVVEYLYEKISGILSSAPITYVKWDMNRSISDVYSSLTDNGEILHKYVLGLYSLLERLINKFPNVLFEGCSGGGGRFDAGMLYYTPQIWCSDNTDAIDRLTIQYGTSFGYPINTVGSHVSATPNHQTGRITPFETRGIVALNGSFGYEMDLSKITEKEEQLIKEQIKFYKKVQPLVYKGKYYRLTNPTKDVLSANMIVDKNKENVLFTVVYQKAVSNGYSRVIKLKGLNPNIKYKINLSFEANTECKGQWDGIKEATGDYLMKAGISLPRQVADYASVCLYLEKI